MRITLITSQNRDTIFIYGVVVLKLMERSVYVDVLSIKYQELLNNTQGFHLKCPSGLTSSLLKVHILQRLAAFPHVKMSKTVLLRITMSVPEEMICLCNKIIFQMFSRK